MSEQDKNENGGEGSGTTPPIPQAFTQEDLTRVATREKDQGKRQGRNEVLEALGLSSIEEAQGLAKALRDAEAATMSEAQRAAQQAAQEKAAAEQLRKEAKQERFEAKVERQLLRAGIDEKSIGKVSKLVEADVDSSDDDIATAIADLKQDMPQLFSPPEGGDQEGDGEGGNAGAGSNSSTTGTPPPHSDPGKAPGTKGKKPSGERAKERLMARHGDRINQRK